MGGEELQQQAPTIAASLETEVATPPDDDNVSSADTAGGGGSGGGGWGDPAFCGLTGRCLVDMEEPMPYPAGPLRV